MRLDASDNTQYHKISIALLVTRSPNINRIRIQQRMTLDANPGSLCFNWGQVRQQDAINFNNKSAGEKPAVKCTYSTYCIHNSLCAISKDQLNRAMTNEQQFKTIIKNTTANRYTTSTLHSLRIVNNLAQESEKLLNIKRKFNGSAKRPSNTDHKYKSAPGPIRGWSGDPFTPGLCLKMGLQIKGLYKFK